MNSKQKVNDKCLCDSGKKYKNCCINKKTSNVISENITNNLDSNFIRQNIINDMENYANKSQELYNICCNEDCRG